MTGKKRKVTPRLKQEIRTAYLLRTEPKVSVNALAKEFGIGESTLRLWIKNEAWEAQRQVSDPAAKSRLVVLNPDKEKKRRRKQASLPPVELDAEQVPPEAIAEVARVEAISRLSFDEVLKLAIADLAAEAPNTPVRSREGAYKAMADLMAQHNALALNTAEALAEHCVANGISPHRLLEQLQQKWAEQKSAS